MKIIYAKNGEKIQHDGQIHNPDYYDKPVVKAKSVVIYGDYPKIKADYEAINIEVEVLEVAKNNLEQGEPADLSGLVPVEQFDAVAQKLTETEEQLGKAQEAIEQLAPENEKLKAEIASFTLSPEDQKLLLEKCESVKKERDELATKVTSLESKLKKQTAAEAKAAKAAEEAATADQPKE